MKVRGWVLVLIASLTVTAMTAILAACGGGSGMVKAPEPTPPPTSAPTPPPVNGDYNENVPAGSTETLTDDLGGSGSLTLSGGGTLVLTGTNTFTGGSTINTGTLQLGAGGTHGSLAGDVTDNGTLEFDRSDDVTFYGIISGTGSLVQAGTGTLTLTGTNTYTGGTVINSGSTLAIASGPTFTGSVGQSSSILDNGTFDISGATAVPAIGIQSLSGTGTVILGAQSLMLGLESSSGDFSGVISGAGQLILTGSGTEILSGTNTYGGGTLLQEGVLQVSGDASLGAATGHVTFDGGALQAGGSFTLSHAIDIGIDGGTIDTNGHAITIAGAISGDVMGILTKEGAGTLTIVSGKDASTYASETRIAAGTLALSGGGSIASSRLVSVETGAALDISRTAEGASIQDLNGDGLVLLGGRLLTTTGDAGMQFGGVISGMGGVTIAGGTLALAGANTYTGPTTIDAGATLQLVGSGLGNGSIAGNVVDNGVLEFFGGGGNVTFGNTISGAGGVNVSIPATLTLAGSNTYSGGTTVNTGVLAVATDSSLGTTGSTLTLGTQGTLEVTASFSTGRDLVVQAGQLGSVIQTDPGSQLTITGEIGGGGMLVKAGAGVLTLDGNGTWTGGSIVSGGTLQSASTLPGDVTVNGGGTLDAVPEVAGNLSNFGTVAVHAGDTAVDGNYTQSITGAVLGTLAVSLGSKLAVTGTATLNGGTLEVTGKDSGYVANTHTDVLTATGGVTGTFDQLAKDSGVVFTSTTIGYGANDVYLDTTGLNVTVAAQGPDVRYTPASMGSAVRVQGAFDALNSKIARNELGSVPSSFVQNAGAFQQAPDLRAAQDSLESLSGQLYAASAGMALQAIDATSRRMSDRLEQLATYSDMQHAWVRQFGMSGEMARSGYGSVDYQLDGTLTGADMRLGSDAIVGVAMGEGQGLEQLSARFDHNLSHDVEGMAYAGWIHGRWYAHGRIGLGHYHQYMQRYLLLGPGYQPVVTDFSGDYNVTYGESGLHFGLGAMQLTPFADLEYDRVQRNGFAEYGAGGFGLKAGAQTINRSLGGVGFKLARAWRFGAGRSLSVDARAQWRRTMSSSGTVFNASFVGVDEWQPLTGVGLSQRSALFGVDLSAKTSATTNFALGYEYLTGDRGRAMTATADFSVVF